MKIFSFSLFFALMMLFASCEPIFAQSKQSTTRTPIPVSKRMEIAKTRYMHDDSLITEYKTAIKKLEADKQFVAGYFQACHDITVVDSTVKGGEIK